MRKKLLIATGLGLSTALIAVARQDQTPATAPGADAHADHAHAQPTTAPAAPTTQEVMERVSYGYGMTVGTDLAKLTEYDMSVNLESFQQGLKDAMAGAKPKWAQEDMVAAYQAFESVLREKEMSRQQAVMEKASAEGKAFLDANKAKEGVKTTESGLQYQILEEGKGPQPQATDTVKVNYTGTLIDGTKFDASAEHGGPVEFPLNRVIKGWTEGFQLLKVGTKARLFIPADLAYGMQSPDPSVPPNSTLIFDVELLEIVPPATEPAAPADNAPAQQP